MKIGNKSTLPLTPTPTPSSPLQRIGLGLQQLRFGQYLEMKWTVDVCSTCIYAPSTLVLIYFLHIMNWQLFSTLFNSILKISFHLHLCYFYFPSVPSTNSQHLRNFMSFWNKALDLSSIFQPSPISATSLRYGLHHREEKRLCHTMLAFHDTQGHTLEVFLLRPPIHRG